MAKSTVDFKIVEYLGVLSEKSTGWKKELNLVKWGDNEPKFDVREWSEDHTKMGKGIVLTEEELLKLYQIIEKAGE